MQSFSEKYDDKPAKSEIQIGAMDEDLRNSLWNVLYLSHLLPDGRHPSLDDSTNNSLLMFLRSIWANHLKKPVDEMSHQCHKACLELKPYFRSCTWDEAYDLVQFVANYLSGTNEEQEFIDACNIVLEREISGIDS